jgi:hypothetical protein
MSIEPPHTEYRVSHYSMAPSARKTLRWTTVVATGCKRSGRMKQTNHRIRVPDSMYPCSDKERMFMENVGGEEVERFVTTVTSVDGVVTKYPW